MATIELAATSRAARGSRNAPLRRDGLVPGVIYGHNVEPRAIATEAKALARVWMRAGRTQLIDLSIDGGRAQRVLVRELQTNPRNGRTLHADFFAVNLREKLTADVPLVIVGESPAVVDAKVGTLQQLMTALHVECLPDDLPSQLAVDVSGLMEIDDGVHVSDITLPEGVTLVHVDPEELVVKVAALRVTVEGETTEGEAVEATAEGEEPGETTSEE